MSTIKSQLDFSNYYIAASVLFAHFLIGALTFHTSTSTVLSHPKRPIQIQTVALQVTPTTFSTPQAPPSPSPKKPETSKIASQTKKHSIATKPSPTTVQKPQSPPIKKPKTAAATPKSSPTQDVEARDGKQKVLIAKARQAIEQFGNTSPHPFQKKLKSPSAPLPLTNGNTSLSSTPQAITTASLTYIEELSHRLQLYLQLPEYGEVTISLTLLRSGKLIENKILKSESTKNSLYVAKNLPKISFPPFGRNFNGEKQHTFSIQLKNAIKSSNF